MQRSLKLFVLSLFFLLSLISWQSPAWAGLEDDGSPDPCRNVPTTDPTGQDSNAAADDYGSWLKRAKTNIVTVGQWKMQKYTVGLNSSPPVNIKNATCIDRIMNVFNNIQLSLTNPFAFVIDQVMAQVITALQGTCNNVANALDGAMRGLMSMTQVCIPMPRLDIKAYPITNPIKSVPCDGVPIMGLEQTPQSATQSSSNSGSRTTYKPMWGFGSSY